MEIVDYLRVARRRILILIGVPLIAAGVATYMVLSSPAQYMATSTVSAPALVGGSATNQYSGSQAVNQFVAQFQATAQSPEVREEVSNATGIKRGAIAAGLTVSQVGASSVMSLTYTTTQRQVGPALLSTLTAKTLDTMFSTQVALAQQRADTANNALTRAEDAIAKWRSDHDMVDPQRVYQGELDNLNALKQTRANQLAQGNSAAAAALSGSISSAQQKLPSLAPLVGQFEDLTAARASAQATLDQAQLQVLDAQDQKAAADPAKVMTVSPDRQVSDSSTLLSLVLPVTGAAVFVAVALVAMVEMFSRSRAVSRAQRAQVDKGTASGRRPRAAQASAPAGEHRGPVSVVHNGSNGSNGSNGNGKAPARSTRTADRDDASVSAALTPPN